jgi:hypothetical protein
VFFGNGQTDRTLVPYRRSLSERILLDKGRADTTTPVTVSVTMWYTDKFAARENDIEGYINTCFEQGRNSPIVKHYS